MIEYIAFMSVRREHEEMIRSFAPAYDSDVWLTGEVGHAQSRQIGDLLPSLRKIFAFLYNRLKRRPQAALDNSLVGQEQSSVPS